VCRKAQDRTDRTCAVSAFDFTQSACPSKGVARRPQGRSFKRACLRAVEVERLVAERMVFVCL
jgi:hypothetical protein